MAKKGSGSAPFFCYFNVHNVGLISGANPVPAFRG